MSIQQTPGHVLPARSAAKMEAAMAVGAFAIGTGEFAIMGLMPDIAHNLNLSEPQVGHAISAYALGVMVGAPLLAILGAKLLRKHMLLLLMGLYALGNLATAFTPTFGSLVAFRFISGLPHGAYFGVAALVTASVSLVLRELGRTESAGVVVFWFTLLSMVPLGLAMPFYAQGHDLVTWGWLLLIGVVGGIAQICLTAALRWGPVSVVLPMDYSTIIWTTLLGVAIGQGWPMASTWIGAAMIAGSGLYIAWREHVRTRQMRAVRAVGNPIASDRPL